MGEKHRRLPEHIRISRNNHCCGSLEGFLTHARIKHHQELEKRDEDGGTSWNMEWKEGRENTARGKKKEKSGKSRGESDSRYPTPREARRALSEWLELFVSSWIRDDL